MIPSLVQCDLCKQFGDGKNYAVYGHTFEVIFKDMYKAYLKEFNGQSIERYNFVSYFYSQSNFCDKCRPKIRKAKRDLQKLQECKTIIYRIKKHCDENKRRQKTGHG